MSGSAVPGLLLSNLDLLEAENTNSASNYAAKLRQPKSDAEDWAPKAR
jgi:hypothetical protein